LQFEKSTINLVDNDNGLDTLTKSLSEIIPAFERRESVRVDFPWSTWAMTDMLRTFVGLSIN
jgi:hypothetical protein